MSNNHPSQQNNNDSKTTEAPVSFMFSGFEGKYDFNIKEILLRAHALSAQNNWTLVLGLVCIIAFTFGIYLAYLDLFNIPDISSLLDQTSPLTQGQQAIIEITLTLVLAPLWAGVAMLAIATNRKQSLSALSIFEYYKNIPALALGSGIVSLLFTFGLALFFIPGFYVFTVTTFTLPLIADKKLGPITAIAFSIRMSNKYLLKMLQLYVIFLLMLIVVVISFGIAYIWVGPLYFNTKAILYGDLFNVKAVANQVEDQNQSVFDA